MTGAGAPRVVYSDLDGTLLGRGGSLFHDAQGGFTMAGPRAIELICASGAELAFVSGRSLRLLGEDARILGVGRFIAEAGSTIVRDGNRYDNCEPFGHRQGTSVFEEIAATGAPGLLLDHFGPALGYHDPWYRDHQYTHLFRGYIDTERAGELLRKQGHTDLKVVDNGIIEDRDFGMEVLELHAYHLMAASAGKGSAIERDLALSGLTPEDAIACGDSVQDLAMAPHVRRLYLMGNARVNCAGLGDELKAHGNVVVVENEMVEGFLEAIRMEFGA